MLSGGNVDEFASAGVGNRLVREAGKSMNPPISRGGNLRNGFDPNNGR